MLSLHTKHAQAIGLQTPNNYTDCGSTSKRAENQTLGRVTITDTPLLLICRYRDVSLQLAEKVADTVFTHARRHVETCLKRPVDEIG